VASESNSDNIVNQLVGEVLGSGRPEGLDRRALAKALTMVEQNMDTHGDEVAELMAALPPTTKPTWRIGVTGAPGVGKSTLIEELGMSLLASGKSVAVLAVDPSSKKSGGSILGDKVRMPVMSLHPNAFVRPTASKLHHGGTAASTHNAIRVCEAAGFDVIIVETVGVGQGETEVSEVVDMFLLLLLPNSGDDVQGIKRGIMEVADVFVVTKSDLDPIAANVALAQCKSAARLFMSDKLFWTQRAVSTSALSKTGIDELTSHVADFFSDENYKQIATNRDSQNVIWFNREVSTQIVQNAMKNADVSSMISEMLLSMKTEKIDPSVAVHKFSKWLSTIKQ